MYIVYIDESGSYRDGSYAGGLWEPSSRRESGYFVLTCLVVHQSDWKVLFKKLKGIRENLKQTHGVPLKEYLHASELVPGNGIWRHVKRANFSKSKRLKLLKNLLTEYAQLKKYCYYASVFVDKSNSFSNPGNCQELAYENLLNRLEKDLKDDYLIVHDGQEDGAIIRLLRKKRVFNFVAGKKLTLDKFIEDPLFKRAENSYFLQVVDQIGYTVLHYYDKRLPYQEVGNLYESSNLKKLGNMKMCYRTESSEPGHIPVPASIV